MRRRPYRPLIATIVMVLGITAIVSTIASRAASFSLGPDDTGLGSATTPTELDPSQLLDPYAAGTAITYPDVVNDLLGDDVRRIEPPDLSEIDSNDIDD